MCVCVGWGGDDFSSLPLPVPPHYSLHSLPSSAALGSVPLLSQGEGEPGYVVDIGDTEGALKGLTCSYKALARVTSATQLEAMKEDYWGEWY